jgi:hypothetical protein
MSESLNIRKVRPKAYAIFRADGVGVSTSFPGRIKGWKNWTRGATLETRSDGIRVTSYYDIRASATVDVDRAITALRTAGWTVTDDGRIVAMSEAK